MSTTAADVEKALYSPMEEWRLRRALSDEKAVTEQDLQTLLETVRTGAVVAEYAIQSARRRQDTLTIATFGYLLDRIWTVDAQTDVQSASHTLNYLDRALTTLGAFAPHAPDQEFASPKFTVVPALASAVERPGVAADLIKLGRRIADDLEYNSVEFASKARKPWAALENLNAIIPAPYDFTPYLSFSAAPLTASLVDDMLRSPKELRTEAARWLSRESRPLPSPPARAAQQRLSVNPDDYWLTHDLQSPEVDASGIGLAEDPGSLDAESGDREAPKNPAEALGQSDDKGTSEATSPQGGSSAQDVPEREAGEGGAFTVWYGTDRAPHNGDPNEGFDNERDPTGQMHYGRCLVNVPRSHKFGSLGSPWWKRWTRPKMDDRLSLRGIVPSYDEVDFAQELTQVLARVEPEERRVLVFVHGYATTFKQAAIRAAQMGFDLKVEGVTAFFSWPSAGEMVAYPKDCATIEASERNFVDFLMTLAEKTTATRVDLVVHSMGNRLVARSMQEVARRLTASNVRLGAIVLAAPDIDVQVFRMLAAAYPLAGANTTMYVSKKDKALALSKALWRGDRAGYTPPVTVEKDIHTIDVADIDVSRLGHGYYATSQPVLYDIRELLNGKYDPAKRLRLREVIGAFGTYWKLVQ